MSYDRSNARVEISHAWFVNTVRNWNHQALDAVGLRIKSKTITNFLARAKIHSVDSTQCVYAKRNQKHSASAFVAKHKTSIVTFTRCVVRCWAANAGSRRSSTDGSEHARSLDTSSRWEFFFWIFTLRKHLLCPLRSAFISSRLQWSWIDKHLKTTER